MSWPEDYDDPDEAFEHDDEPRGETDCLDCGVCESCIDRSMDHAEDHEMQMECPYCDGEGWTNSTPSMECPECGGTGWY